MKQYLLFGFLLVLMASMALAGTTPNLVYGHITTDSFPVKNVDIRITNLNTHVETISRTNENGFYQVDFTNFDQNSRYGDNIKVSLIYCESLSICSRIEISKESGTIVSWDLSGSVTPLPPEAVIVKFICWDGSAVDDQTKCPSQPLPPPVVINEVQCADGSMVADATLCPETKESWIGMIIAVLTTLFCGGAAYGGWKVYAGKWKHLHRGYNGYHDPSISHTKISIKHTPWKVSKLKCMSDTKKINNGEDLSK